MHEGPAVRAGRVRFESSTVRASVFDVVAFEAVDVRMSGSQLAAEQLLVIEVSVLGGGPTSTIHTDESDLEAVTLCDPGAGAFLGGTLRCVKCDEDAFMGGAAVCIGGARLFERGCPALELAPFCG